MTDIVDRLNTGAPSIPAMRDGAEAIMELRREREALRHRGYLLAMALLQTNDWKALEDDVRAAAESFLPMSLRPYPSHGGCTDSKETR